MTPQYLYRSRVDIFLFRWKLSSMPFIIHIYNDKETFVKMEMHIYDIISHIGQYCDNHKYYFRFFLLKIKKNLPNKLMYTRKKMHICDSKKNSIQSLVYPVKENGSYHQLILKDFVLKTKDKRLGFLLYINNFFYCSSRGD